MYYTRIIFWLFRLQPLNISSQLLFSLPNSCVTIMTIARVRVKLLHSSKKLHLDYVVRIRVLQLCSRIISNIRRTARWI